MEDKIAEIERNLEIHINTLDPLVHKL